MNLSNIKHPHYLLPAAALLMIMLVAVGVASAQQLPPGAPTNVQVSATDTEATITWSDPASGEGVCAATDYQVWVEKISDGERTGGNEVTSPWKATGLEPSTNYAVSIYTYGAACDEYSAEPAEATFSTTAADANDAAEPTEKHAPKRVRGLSAVKTTGQTDEASLSWNAPRTKNGKHHAATEYAVEVSSVAENGDKTEIETIFDITATQATVDNLTAGVYRFRVAAHSSECNCWGKWRAIRYTHQ